VKGPYCVQDSEMAKQTIGITIKLFGGIDQDSGFFEYDPDKGLDLAAPEGIRLAKALKAAGVKVNADTVCFVNGVKAGLRVKLKDGDAVFCMKVLAGG
jgi:hypothetical protein